MIIYNSLEIHNPKNRLKIEMNPFKSKEIPGYSTNIDPMVNPIIEKKV